MNMMQYFRFFQDLWRLFREFGNPVAADEYWTRLISTANQLAEKYGETDFACRMVCTVVEEIDRAYKENPNANNRM